MTESAVRKLLAAKIAKLGLRADPGISSHPADCRCAHCWSIREARKLVEKKDADKR